MARLRFYIKQILASDRSQHVPLKYQGKESFFSSPQIYKKLNQNPKILNSLEVRYRHIQGHCQRGS